MSPIAAAMRSTGRNESSCCIRVRRCSRMGRTSFARDAATGFLTAQAPVSDFEPAAEVLDQAAPIVVPEQLVSRAIGDWDRLHYSAVSKSQRRRRSLVCWPPSHSPAFAMCCAWALSLVSERSFPGGMARRLPTGRARGHPAVVAWTRNCCYCRCGNASRVPFSVRVRQTVGIRGCRTLGFYSDR